MSARFTERELQCTDAVRSFQTTFVSWVTSVYNEEFEEANKRIATAKRHVQRPYAAFVETCRREGIAHPESTSVVKILEIMGKRKRLPVIAVAEAEWDTAKRLMFAHNHQRIRSLNAHASADWYQLEFLPTLTLGRWTSNRFWEEVPNEYKEAFTVLVDTPEYQPIDESEHALKVLDDSVDRFMEASITAENIIQKHADRCAARVREEFSARKISVEIEQCLEKLEPLTTLIKEQRNKVSSSGGSFLVAAAIYKEMCDELVKAYQLWQDILARARIPSDVLSEAKRFKDMAEEEIPQMLQELARESTSDDNIEQYRALNNQIATAQWYGELEKTIAEIAQVLEVIAIDFPVLLARYSYWLNRQARAKQAIDTARAYEKKEGKVIRELRYSRLTKAVALDVAVSTEQLVTEIAQLIETTATARKDWKKVTEDRIKEAIATCQTSSAPGAGFLKRVLDLEQKCNLDCAPYTRPIKQAVEQEFDLMLEDIKMSEDTIRLETKILRPFVAPFPKELSATIVATPEQHRVFLHAVLELRRRTDLALQTHRELESHEAGYIDILAFAAKNISRPQNITFYWSHLIDWLRLASLGALYAPT